MPHSMKWNNVSHICHSHISVCLFVCVFVYLVVRNCACLCVFLHVHLHVYVWWCVSVYLRVYVCVCLWMAVQRIEELEATLYSALQQEQPACQAVAESLTDRQREELRLAVDKLRRQILRQSRQFDSQILQERMELLQQAQQVRFKANQVRWLSRASVDMTPGLCVKIHRTFGAMKKMQYPCVCKLYLCKCTCGNDVCVCFPQLTVLTSISPIPHISCSSFSPSASSQLLLPFL